MNSVFVENDKVKTIYDNNIYVVKSVSDTTALVERDSNIHEMACSDLIKVEEKTA